MTQTEPATIATPVAVGTEAASGPLAMRVEKAIIEDAGPTIASTSEQNADAPEGLSYFLADITVGNNGQQPIQLSVTDFSATGTDGVLRRCPSIALPDPPLNVSLEAGETFTGWVAGLVNDLSSVVLLFDPAVSVGPRFAATFALTEGATLPTFESGNAAAGDTGSTLEAPARLGQTVGTTSWELTVNESIGVDTYYEISDYRVGALGQPGPNGWEGVGSAIGLDITIRNLSDVPLFFSWTALELIDTNGEPWDHLLAMTQPQPPASVELLPGAMLTGWYGILTQPWATTSLLRFRESRTIEGFRFISLDGTAGSTTTSESPETPEPEDATPSAPLNLAPGDLVEVGDDPLNLRSDASVNGELITELDPGTQLAITGEVVEGEGYRWYPVEVVDTGESGFIAEDFITPVDD